MTILDCEMRQTGKRDSPLMPADDSIEVNSSSLTPQEVLNIVLKIYKQNIKEV